MDEEKIPVQPDRDNKSKRQADVEINLSQKRMQAIIELKFKAMEVSRSNTDDDVKKRIWIWIERLIKWSNMKKNTKAVLGRRLPYGYKHFFT
mgnify:CR=1 FL=1